MPQLVARREDLTDWSTTTKRVRWDYDSEDHLLEEMLDQKYWTSVAVGDNEVRSHGIKRGDIVHITDAAQEQCVIRINHVDLAGGRVMFSVQERIVDRPILIASGKAGAYYVKWRGPRGRYWCIMDGNTNAVVEPDFRSQAEALERLKRLEVEAEIKAAA